MMIILWLTSGWNGVADGSRVAHVQTHFSGAMLIHGTSSISCRDSFRVSLSVAWVGTQHGYNMQRHILLLKAPSNVDFQPEMKWTQLSLNLTWHFTIHDYHQTFRFLASTVPGQSSHKPFEMAPSLQFVLPSTFVTSCSWSTRWVRADSAPPRPPRPPSWGPKRQRRRGRGAIGAAPGRGATWRGWFERIFWISVLGDLTISIFLED